MSQPSICIQNLNKVYDDNFIALSDINLTINKGEIFALLGPNGAGKTTLISIICGIANATAGTVTVNGYNIHNDYRQTRQLIGLVPQELTTEAFESVWDTVTFSRGLFGKPKNPALIEDVLKKLSLWDKRNNRIMTLSGGMKRRLMIAKALSHEPSILFLDEPTAGVDVELRKQMWDQVKELRNLGVTIILTTHYIEEAEDMADRIGIINNGKLLKVEHKQTLLKTLGKKHLKLTLNNPLQTIPPTLAPFNLEQTAPQELIFNYNTTQSNPIQPLLQQLQTENITICDLQTVETSLEDIFLGLTS
jgi:ABC-2 type transport system ATP-binding protein